MTHAPVTEIVPERSRHAASAELDDPAAQDDPYEVYAHWRRTEPVRRGPIGEWYLTRYDDVLQVLRDPATFSSSLEGTWLHEQLTRRFRLDPDEPVFHVLTERREGPEHTRMRKLTSKALAPRTVERLRPRVEEIAHELLERVDNRSFELMADFAYPLPVTVISELLGVPAGDRELFARWSRDLMVDGLGSTLDDPQLLHRWRQGNRDLAAYLSDVVADRGRSPRDDLISALLAAREGGERLTEQELIGLCMGLLIAGHETTANLLGNGILALLRHPQQLRRLRDDVSLTASAVEEMLRYDGPAKGLLRAVTQDVELRGVVVRRHDLVVAMVGAANRDPEVFPRPDEFDIGRTDNRHLAFGHGIHFCLGAPLARLEAQIALPALLRRFPHLALRTERPRWRPSPLLRGLEELPLAV